MANSVETEYKVNSPEVERLKKLKADFAADFRAEKEWRTDKEEYGKFYDGDQLSDEEKKAMEDRGQPAVVINRIKPKLDSIFGIQNALQVDTKAYPAGNREVEAEFISEELRHIEDDSDFDNEESLAFQDQCIDGRAWYKLFKEFDGLDGVDRIKHVSNEKIVLDRYCSEEDRRTGDLKTAKRIHETIWVDLEDAMEMFPRHKDALQMAIDYPDIMTPILADKLKEYNPDQYAQMGGEQLPAEQMQDIDIFIDKKLKRIRLVTTYYRKPKVKRFLKSSAGTVEVTKETDAQVKKMMDELEGAVTWDETTYSINSCTFAWNEILEEKKDIRPYDKQGKFPLIMIPGYVSRDRKHKPYGIVKQLIDPQKEVNKRRSKMLHLLNVNQTWYEDGAFDDPKRARKEMAKPDGMIGFKPQFKVERVTHEVLATSQYQLLQESKSEVDQAGVNREIEGSSSANSGKEFQLRQQAAMQSIRMLFANLRAARKRIGYYLLDEILYRKPELVTQFGISRFDIIIDEAPDTINLQSETFAALSGMAERGLPIPPEMIIEVSPLSPGKKKEFIERSQQMQEQQMQMAMAQAQAKGQA